MTLPTSTYRLQFRNGMTFDEAVTIVPYLKALGISHLYASPIFTATAGSTHGYDVTDANEIDPVLGGRAGFDRLTEALSRNGIGLILDIVPNHMASSLENAWWRDVLRNGKASPYADHFDIDWTRRLTLPQLGKSFDEAVADGEFKLQRVEDGSYGLGYYDTVFPLSPDTSRALDAETGGDPARLAALSADPARLKALHEQQAWELCYWKDASTRLSYRRFFEVSGLVGLRVEDEAVFADAHRLVLDLVRDGTVQGLRLDHIDGLADPKAYLERLRQAVGPDVYIVVEKILGDTERVAKDWPISGTTGYEFITALSHLFIAPEGLDELDRAYHVLAPETADFHEGLRKAKSLMTDRNFEGEMTRLVGLAHRLSPEVPQEDLRLAIRELVIAFPVYRTYGAEAALTEADEAVLTEVIEQAEGHLRDRTALDLVVAILRGETQGETAREFRARFQQLSGPVMAKAMEDTLFYRYNRLIAANEVGGEPAVAPGGVALFHRRMAERAETQPHGISSTSTHDTKRGEDARARLYTLSEAGDVWARAVDRWRLMNTVHRSKTKDGQAPEANTEWLLYQALAGIWPEDFTSRDAEEFKGRFLAYVEKAMRESKLHSDWSDQNEAYEKAVLDFAAELVSSENLTFVEDFGITLRPFIETGYLNSLSQTLIKLTAPGIPDIYQGSESWDDSLVDPDNRRSVNYDVLRNWIGKESAVDGLTVPQLKQRLIRIVLHHRLERPDLYLDGAYLPLEVTGERRDHVVAFARHHQGEACVTVVPRLMFGHLEPGLLVPGDAFWGDTELVLPEAARGVTLERLMGHKVEPAARLPLSKLLARQPVAFLMQG